LFAMQKHDIDIAKGIQFAAAVATEGDDSKRRITVSVIHDMIGRCKNVTQQHVDQINPARANFAATVARTLAQAQAVLFEFQKFAINRQNIGRTLRTGGGQFPLRMGQDFFEMPRHKER
jgi:hypothetical protein